MSEILRFPNNNNESKNISPVSPTSPNNHPCKTSFYRNLLAGTALMLAIGMTMMPRAADAAPSGGVVANGSAAISTDGNKTFIHQNSARAAINWAGFDVAANEAVEFIVPNKGATLNTISGSQTQINGRIASNGTLYFVNQNGFVFGANSQLSAANVILSTEKIEIDHFMANSTTNRQQFTEPALTNATISLNGTITVQDRGIVALFAPVIENNDTALITAQLGTVVLASGTVNTIDFNGDGLMKFELSDYGQGISVTNNGRITAAGGQVILTAKRAKDFLNSIVTNNGIIETEGEAGQSGKITLSAVNGVVKLAGGSINSGDKGDLTLSQTANNADLTLDENALATVKFGHGTNLFLSSGRDVSVTGASNIHDLGRVSIIAARHITLKNNLTATGDLSLMAGGNILLYNTLSTDGNLVLTAKNRGVIAAAKAITANNITAISDSGAIEFYGKVTATHHLVKGGNVAIWVKSGRGEVVFHDEIFASNVSVNTENGAVKFMKHITLNMVDPNALFENEADRAKIPPASSTAIQDGEINVGINGDGDIVFAKEASLSGITRYTKYIRSQDGAVIATSNYYDSNNVNRFILSTNSNIKLQTNVEVRADGQFNISSKLLEHEYITANNASIAIRVSGAEFDQYDPMSGGLKLYVNSTNLVLDDKISFVNAKNAVFSTPGKIYVLQNVSVDNLSLTFHELHFLLPSSEYSEWDPPHGSINVHNGGKFTLASNQSFSYDNNLLKYVYNSDNVNLTLKSLDNLTIAAAINVAGGRSLNLTAKTITVNADITSQDGHVTFRYVNRNGKSTSLFDQNTANHMKLSGNNTFAVFASNNLLINGQVNNLNIADFAVEGAGTLTINAELTARQHLGFRSFGHIYINKQVRTLPGGEAVEYILPNKDKNLHFGGNAPAGGNVPPR